MVDGKKSKKAHLGKNIMKNPWILSTLIFGILAIVFIVFTFKGSIGCSANVISEQSVGEYVSDYLDSLGIDATVDSISDVGSFYEVIISVGDSSGPIYLTKDGLFRIQPLGSLELEDTQTTEQPASEAPKSDIPKAELFIWAYCPYGVTALAPFAEVAKLFGDKVDFTTVLYYDGHGAFETQQNKIQECIQKYDKANYWDYAIQFSETIYPVCGASREVACDLDMSTDLMKTLGIDSDAILTCVDNEGTGLIAAASSRAKAMGVTGSPSFVLNDVLLSVARNAEAYKDATCQSFNNIPDECGEALSSASTTTTGSC